MGAMHVQSSSIICNPAHAQGYLQMLALNYLYTFVKLFNKLQFAIELHIIELHIIHTCMYIYICKEYIYTFCSTLLHISVCLKLYSLFKHYKTTTTLFVTMVVYSTLKG